MASNALIRMFATCDRASVYGNLLR